MFIFLFTDYQTFKLSPIKYNRYPVHLSVCLWNSILVELNKKHSLVLLSSVCDSLTLHIVSNGTEINNAAFFYQNIVANDTI